MLRVTEFLIINIAAFLTITIISIFLQAWFILFISCNFIDATTLWLLHHGFLSNIWYRRHSKFIDWFHILSWLIIIRAYFYFHFLQLLYLFLQFRDLIINILIRLKNWCIFIILFLSLYPACWILLIPWIQIAVWRRMKIFLFLSDWSF